MKKIIFGALILLMITCWFAAWMDHKTKDNENEWEKFTAQTMSLVGHERGDAAREMTAMGMHLRSTVRNKNDWSKATNRVSPRPPARTDEVALKYTDGSTLRKKCAFLYINGDGKVSNVRLAVERM